MAGKQKKLQTVETNKHAKFSKFDVSYCRITQIIKDQSDKDKTRRIREKDQEEKSRRITMITY